MSCRDRECPYCVGLGVLTHHYRVRLTEPAFHFLRKHNRNVSEYVRGLILRDIHRSLRTEGKARRGGR